MNASLMLIMTTTPRTRTAVTTVSLVYELGTARAAPLTGVIYARTESARSVQTTLLTAMPMNVTRMRIILHPALNLHVSVTTITGVKVLTMSAFLVMMGVCHVT